MVFVFNIKIISFFSKNAYRSPPKNITNEKQGVTIRVSGSSTMFFNYTFFMFFLLWLFNLFLSKINFSLNYALISISYIYR